MVNTLNDTELRVLGCLIEKQLATPAYYPLTLNSLLSACNQRSNRDPVTDYPEHEVQQALGSLMDKGYASRIRITGSRVDKFGHNVPDLLDLSPRETAVLAELMLRGAQTPGELKQRASRMTVLEGLEDVHQSIESLAAQSLVLKLERMPGQKERRYKHLLGDESAHDESATQAPAPAAHPVQAEQGAGLFARVDALELEVAELRQEVERLRQERG